MEGFNIEKIDFVYISYDRNHAGLNKLQSMLSFFGLLNLCVVVENSAAPCKSSDVIIGTNELMDYSGYREGVAELLRRKNHGHYVLLVNDTYQTNRYFGFVSHMLLALSLLRIKLTGKRCLLMGETSGSGFGETIYGVKVKRTFSSYLFVIDYESITDFFNSFYIKVQHDIYLQEIVKSRASMVGCLYLEVLNKYLGFSESESQDRWYKNAAASQEIKTKKAKCLVLERIMPSWVLNKGGVVMDLYPNRAVRILHSIEAKLAKSLNAIKYNISHL